MPAQPMPPPQLLTPPQAGLEAYRAIEQSSRHMLAAAQAAQWAQFWQLGLQCRQQVQALQQIPTPATLAAPDAHDGHGANDAGASPRHSEKHAILLRILQNDALIRALTEPSCAATRALQAGGLSGGLAAGIVSTQLH